MVQNTLWNKMENSNTLTLEKLTVACAFYSTVKVSGWLLVCLAVVMICSKLFKHKN